jgi:hypothetical protein
MHILANMGVLALSQVALLLILAISAIVVGAAVAIAPGERRLGLLRPLTLGTTFAALAAVLGGIAAAFSHLHLAGGTDEALSMAWAGIAESTVPGIVAFTALALAWGLAALGMRRLN